jgi:hypothetical protein
MFQGYDKERLVQDYQDTRIENNKLLKENHLLKTRITILENEVKQSYALVDKLEAEGASN